ncbi:MAG: hypothetical protein KF836_13600 [Fimbriimonadaceae bacterium]|nr:hypothetical protein [Fimbriimonadaceae bacterium]
MIIEVSCGTVEEALLAAEFGADRIEICAALSTGGVTPSPSTFLTIKRSVPIPVFVMVLQPEADFTPNEPDFQAMLDDVEWFAENGADGFCFGCLDSAGKIDEFRNRELIVRTNGKPATFHRVFDESPRSQEDLKLLKTLGFARILTSGCKTNVENGMDGLKELLATSPIPILAGGGVRETNAKALQELGIAEIHFSLRAGQIERTGYQGAALPKIDPERITRVRQALVI